MRATKILKFGGSSMGSAESILKVIAIIKKELKKSVVPAIVVSAVSQVTNRLIEAGKFAAERGEWKNIVDGLEARHKKMVISLLGGAAQKSALADEKRLFDSLRAELDAVAGESSLIPSRMDSIMSYGERLSAHMLADALKAHGVLCEYANASDFVVTDDNFGSAMVDFRRTNEKLAEHFRARKVPQVVTGFIGGAEGGAVTTLGRGGSDYSAAIIGAGLNMGAIEIWTDVSGFMTADPQKVKEAALIVSMSYAEAAELSYFGAKVIHPKTLHPAQEKNIPIFIKNTFEPGTAGTVIEKDAQSAEGLVRGISSINDIALLRVQGGGMSGTYGIAGRIFGALSRVRVNVVLITQGSSENSITIAVAPQEAQKAKAAIEAEFATERRSRLIDDVLIENDLSIIAIVGEGMRHQRGLAGRFFQTLGRNGINVVAIAQGSSELNVSAVIKQSEEIKALNAVHAAFFAPERKIINIFLVGVGLIGSTLLEQIHEQKEALAREHGYAIRLTGIANTKNMLFSPDGINTGSWRKALEKSRTKMNIEDFVETMKSMGLPESVFVDCTASENVASCYADVLRAGISVVTPNKRANSGTYEQYKELKRRALKHGVKFLYETNVGAGLPVISTINDLMLSGDKIIKIEAILSGTLSYIFNNFSAGKSFSEIVARARELGYTEPDPRSDLDGMDVARKILILAREAGFPLELKGVRVKGLLNPQLQKAKSIDDFFVKLKKEDPSFEKKRKDADKKGQVLRFIATLSKGKATVSLQSVGKEHPFYSLSGNDNVIAFTTKRYSTTPIVIKGPGAGAKVTAAGVFADILRIPSRVV